jgi:uncharacterized protein YdeI (YjbR/CyaY-like superfamily)
MEPTFFASPADFRAWLEEHHATDAELLVGFHKKRSGRPSITWPEAVDQALCFGWIDGVRRSLDDTSYTIRFTPRKPTSTWSKVNIERVAELTKQGLMRPAGLRAFEQRAEARSGIYSYEQREAAQLDPDEEAQFRANTAAWEDWQRRPPSYRKAATWWVVSAKRPQTRAKRLAQLIEESANGRRIAQLTPPKDRQS